MDLCATVTRKWGTETTVPDFNKISSIMADEYGLNHGRRYWVVVHYFIRHNMNFPVKKDTEE